MAMSQGAVEEENTQYNNAGPLYYYDIETKPERYPDRPTNPPSSTFFFHELLTSLFDPLNDNKKKATGPSVARAKRGPAGPTKLTPHEARRNIIARFISRWRKEVGNDFYPALRLIIPEKDRDRPMYGLKEKAIGKLLVKLLNISPSSDDGFNLLNWKLPGQTTASRMAGDFAGRCYEVISKRSMRQGFGDMRIEEVNEMLDKLSAAQKEENQLPIFEKFYNRMNADELMWLIRIILRQMKVGATEKTILDLWHPDGETMFNITSSLRKVCWDLTNPEIRLGGEEAGITIMHCFQPQLAQFHTHTFEKMVERLGWTPEDPDFWIEEKLDGERMQMHMMEDDDIPGGRRFRFWSRKAKDYTYLYGNSFEDDSSALTRHIKPAFDSSVRNIILDGEMITWDPETNKMVAFGTLKTAAISTQRNPFQGTGIRPLFRVFDCLYLNDTNLTRYELRDRRKALEGAVKNVPQRLEKHHYDVAGSAKAIEPALQKVIAEASEGLVLKNPRSMYRLNSRNDDWMKVKPEYMMDFGESLDCVVIAGYYGSGHRGGNLSSFLCGLRVDQNHIMAGANPMKCWSFFKVGGGFRAQDYSEIRHRTSGKWIDWDSKHPPNEFIELGGGDRQFERPDVWIKPGDSVILEVKAASVGNSDQFRTGFTLRFPRFKKIRTDKDWESALSLSEFAVLQSQVKKEAKEKGEFKVETKRKMTKRLKKETVIAGNEISKTPYAGPKTEVFHGLNFCVMSEMTKPYKKTKGEIEQIIKANGGAIFQSPTVKDDIVCVGDKRVVAVASLIKSGHRSVVKPTWVLDALKQAEIDGPDRQRFLLPFEPNQMFHMTEEVRESIEGNVDDYGDSYARDVNSDELKRILDDMIHPKNYKFSPNAFLSQLEEHGHGLGELPGSLFARCVVRFISGDDQQKDSDFLVTKNRFLFAGGIEATDGEEDMITHFVVRNASADMMRSLWDELASWGGKLPRIVDLKWLQDSWSEKTLLDEESYTVS
ncbi:DNA ligase 4 [Lachnellula arida]|uniref:DNA ligase n=1 Tax=Lachnellula arida TaxID=1316785 RepID=A0A8T9BNZ4_9HELO|nr:DNA ligase 4 [Lachnellula arida]